VIKKATFSDDTEDITISSGNKEITYVPKENKIILKKRRKSGNSFIQSRRKSLIVVFIGRLRFVWGTC
jgi:hypothetical protein